MQVARAHVDQAAHIALGVDHCADVFCRYQTQLMAITEAAQLFGVVGKALQLAGLVRQVAVAPRQVAGNRMALDPLADDIHRFQAHQLEAVHTLLAEHWQKLLKAMADPANQLTTVAPAGAPADFARFEQDHRQAALGQFDGRVQARIATADDAHVGAVLALQSRVICLWRAAGGVIGGGVLRAVDHRIGLGEESKAASISR